MVLDGETFTVIGVTPAEFVFPSADTDIFVPMGFYSERMCWENRGCSQGSWAIGRLADGTTLGAAQADLDRIAIGITETEGEQQAVARLESLTDAYVGDIRAPDVDPDGGRRIRPPHRVRQRGQPAAGAR